MRTGSAAIGLGRQPRCERAAAPWNARHLDVAAHHAAEPPADGEAKACAAIAARGRCIGLGEVGEQPLELLRSDADAGIGDGELDAAVAAADGKPNLAALCELAG